LARLVLGGELRDGETVTIDAEQVTKAFGNRPIIKDFTLRIQRGDRIGLVGANGTGKTTLLKLLTGELQPDSGTVTPSTVTASA
jgi:ATP-binding cassette subfamily F protein uup